MILVFNGNGKEGNKVIVYHIGLIIWVSNVLSLSEIWIFVAFLSSEIKSLFCLKSSYSSGLKKTHCVAEYLYMVFLNGHR